MSAFSVLIVEDEQIFALDLQQRLEQLGYDAFAIASSCSEAIECVGARKPDIVLMDIRIEGRRDGVETADLLRRQHGVPVIYLTSHGDEATFDRAKLSEPYGYLLKPVKAAELRRTLEISLQRSTYEREIRARERWFATTLRSLTDGVVTFDVDDQLHFINPAAHELALAANEADESAQIFEMEPLGVTEEFVFVDKNGRKRTVLRTKNLVCDEFSILGRVLVLRDITEQIEAAQQLAIASRMASLGTLAAGVAHEINNPLTVILGNSSFIHERLHDAAENPEIYAAFADILGLELEVQEAAERIRSIVSGMMIFAHPGQKATKPANVEEVVAKAVNLTRYNLEHRAKVLTNVQPNLPLVPIDDGKLSQVLVNLITNAAHAMPTAASDRNVIQIGARLENRHVQISVSDNGKGMSEATMAHVFDPFFTTKDVGQGTGLGLSICHGIISSAGGQLTVQSKEHTGTIFTVLLPLSPELVAAEPAAELASETTPNVLMVDADPVAQRLVTRILDSYEVAICSTLEAALQRIQQGERFSAIMIELDNDVPSSMGFFDMINALDPDLASRIVFVAGGPIEPSEEEWLRNLSNLCVRKPYDIKNLREVMSDIVDRE